MPTIENRGPELFVVCVTLLTAAVLSSFLRCCTRLGIVRAFGADDWAMMAATISFILFVTCAITGIHYGTGRHFTDLETPDIMKAMMYWWFCYIFYAITMIASKISIGIFLLRLTVKQLHRLIIYVVVLLTVVAGLVFFFVTIFQCSPVSFFWTKTGGDTNGSCLDAGIIAALTYLYSAISVICDFTFAILPIFMIWGLQMDRKTKIALIPILSMACVASAAVVVRFAYIERFKDPDFLWATLDIAIWSTTEQGLAITAGSLATIRPLYYRVAMRMGFGSTPVGEPPSYDMPQTIGSLDKAKAAAKAGRGLFSLPTFVRDDDEVPDPTDGDSGLKLNSIGNTTADGTTKTNSVWSSSNGYRYIGSEEELRLKPSQETIDGTRVAPKAFVVADK
ncbi:hypothetical protein F4778DRAFT_731815 [Xylariomycetidae sp. FL2044]|nr:hypothetical protein F4778DRAFT_731815 [Xylariomycetidae sp. FL2044]